MDEFQTGDNVGIAWENGMQNTEGARDEKADWILQEGVHLILTGRAWCLGITVPLW